jgi:peptidoglycan/xylan/chitin deacetylase (PgdA/CDA1 family)
VLRRVAIAALPAVAAAAVVTVIIGSESGRPRATPVAAHARTERAAGAAAGARTASRRPLRTPPNEVRGAAARRLPVPILMYHVIADPPSGTPYPGLWVRPRLFAAEMAALRRAGYWAISLRQAWRAWTRGAPLPPKPVVVSFDDGYLGDYTHARPVLRRLGWPGVLNLELDNVGRRNLDAREVRALIADGWELDSHTIHHPDLTTVSDARLKYELVASRRAISQRFGVSPEFFCYPYGRYNARVEAAVARAGYRAATTENEGYATAATPPFELPRMRVQSVDTPAGLLARLRAERPRS